MSAVTWEDVFPKLKDNKLARQAYQLCKQIKQTEGDPARRRYRGVKSKWQEFDLVSVFFRNYGLNIYIKGERDDAEQYLKSKFHNTITVYKWKLGYSFEVRTEKQFNDLKNWFKLK